MRMSNVLAALLTLAVTATSARAQSERIAAPSDSVPHWRFAAADGGGDGTGSLSCTACGDGSSNGAAGFVRAGGAFGAQLVVAAQIDWWGSKRRLTSKSADVSFHSTAVVVQWFPSSENGLFATVGFGHGSSSLRADDPIGSADVNAEGLCYQLGTGYAVPLGTHISITPYANYLTTPGGKSANSVNQLSGSVIQFGLGLGWR